MDKKRVLINLVSNILSFIIQLGINFIVTPIIVLKVGDAAYGFVGLANNFVSYANIFTIVINSMASRFITVEYVKDKKDEANKYYSSVFFMNIIMSILIFVVTTIFIMNIDVLLNVPQELLGDVKITFVLSFINLILSLFNTIFNVAAFVSNRIDLSAIRNIAGNLIKTILLILMFVLFRARIYYIVLSTIIMSLFLIISNYRLSKKLCPDLVIKKEFFEFKYVKVLAKSGIWNSINSLSKTLLTGLDLLMANLFVGPVGMGILSIAKTIPTAIENLLATFSNTFNPQFVLLYSKGNKEELIHTVNYSLKIIGLIMLVPLAGIIAFGIPFFHLWLPAKSDQEIINIQILSILSILPFIISASNYTLFVLDSVTNKLKRPVIATFIMSLLSTVTTIILLKITDWGVFAIAGVSSMYWIIKVFFFNTINAAINLNIKWYTFFRPFLKNLLCFSLVLVFYVLINNMIAIYSYFDFILYVGIFGIIGYIFCFLFLLSKNEKDKFLKKLKSIYNRKT